MVPITRKRGLVMRGRAPGVDSMGSAAAGQMPDIPVPGPFSHGGTDGPTHAMASVAGAQPAAGWLYGVSLDRAPSGRGSGRTMASNRIGGRPRQEGCKPRNL